MNVLIIAPHADDEILGCGGAIGFHREVGDRVFVQIIADRIPGRTFDAKHVAKVRRQSEKAGRCMGIEKIFYAGFPDMQLDGKSIDLIWPIEDVIRKVKPGLVYVPNDTDTDQDHRAVAWACKVAARFIPDWLIYEIPGPSVHFVPNYYLDVKKYYRAKVAALKIYKGELRDYPHPRSLKGIEILARKRGLECNLEMAEAFRVGRWVVNKS